MSVVFGDAESLHRHLLKFTARSGREVTYDGETYLIHHTQYASYDLQDAFETAVAGTTLDPRDDFDFSDELDEAIEDSRACISDYDLRHHYNDREYIDTSDLHRAASNYHMYHLTIEEDGRDPLDCARPQATSREAAIAEIFTLMHAFNAGMKAFLPFGVNGPPFYGDDDDDAKPDEGLDHNEIAFALRDTTAMLHGPSALRQPDPSLHTTRVLYEIYDEIGMKQTVRDVYGVFVNPTRPGYYEPDDAAGRRRSRMVGDMMMSATGHGTDHNQRWTSVDEPPLETLDSYTPRSAESQREET